jgi:hypothetical protein
MREGQTFKIHFYSDLPATADNTGQKIYIQMLCTSFGLER